MFIKMFLITSLGVISQLQTIHLECTHGLELPKRAEN